MSASRQKYLFGTQRLPAAAKARLAYPRPDNTRPRVSQMPQHIIVPEAWLLTQKQEIQVLVQLASTMKTPSGHWVPNDAEMREALGVKA